MIRSVHRCIAAVTVIAMLVLPSSAAVIAGVARVIAHCCCGAHDGASDCGCPDCPAGNERASDERRATPSLTPCGAEAELYASSIAVDRFLLPVAASTIPPRPDLRAQADDDRWPPRAALPPPTPPPEPGLASA